MNYNGILIIYLIDLYLKGWW